MKIRTIKLHPRQDPRGWLIENELPALFESTKHFFVAYSRPGVVRGQHYHRRKREWFLTFAGEARIVFEDVASKERTEISVCGEKPEIVEVPPLQAHAIENVGKGPLYLLALVNEPLDRANPDTYPYPVIPVKSSNKESE